MQNKKRELKVVLVISKTEVADTTFKTVEYENLSYQSNNIPSVKGSTASKPLLRTILGDGGKHIWVTVASVIIHIILRIS